MNVTHKSGKLTGGDRLMAGLLRWLPWLSFFFVALPAPLYFFLRYLTATEDIAVYMLLVLLSLAVSSLAGLVVVVLLLLYRRHWEKRLRNRLAADGITTDELSWFQSELTSAERRALKEMEAQNPLLADAYRETLAARLTAARVISNTRRETAEVERRLKHVSRLGGTERATLEQDLRSDRARLEQIAHEALGHQREAETRLQMIEAAARRGASEAEVEIALRRLGTMRENVPYALEAARLEREAREQAEEELRENDRRLSNPNI